MELWILFGTFVSLMLIGTPIAFCLGIAAFATVALYGPAAAGGFPAAEFRHERVFAARHSLLHLFRRPDGAGRHRQRIVNFAASLVGHVRGGLGQVNIVTCDAVRRHFRLCCG
jgi:hypothetical protein